MVDYPYTLIVDVPLDFFTKVNKTDRRKVLIGKSGCLRTLSGAGCIIFSGAKALARKVFRIIKMRRGRVRRGRLLRCTTLTRDTSSRPVDGDVRGTCNGSLSHSHIDRVRRVDKGKVATGMSKEDITTKGTGLVSHLNVPCGAYRGMKAVVRLTVSNRCTKRVIVSSIRGPASGRTVTGLGRTKVRGAVVLAKSTGRITSRITTSLNVSRIRDRLLPKSGIRRMRELLTRGPTGRGLTFIKSNVGSTPILKETSVNVTVKTVKSSTTVRTTSIILVSSSPLGVIGTVQVSGGYLKVMCRGVMFTLTMGNIYLVLKTLKVTGV